MKFDVPQSHTHGPSSSHDAEHRHRMSGRMARNANYAFELVRCFPDYTSRELFKFFACKMELAEVRRRLTGLMNDGRIVQGEQRTCTVAKTKAVTWRVADVLCS